MQGIRKYKIAIMFTLMALTFSIAAQECLNYYKSRSCADYHRKDFYLHGQSRSTVMEIGVKSQMEAVLNGGRDYIVTCCTDPDFYPIHFTIEAKDGGEVLYDNMHDDYLNSIGFTLENTQTVVISVTILAEGYNPEDFDENRSCVGVSIQFRKTPRLGF